MESTRNGVADSEFEFSPVVPERLDDIKLFSEQHGKFRYCSCMRWRMRSIAFSKSSKGERIEALESLICEDVPVGILAYREGHPVGWCSVAPRHTYSALQVSRTMPPVDDMDVWSVVCFFVDKTYRRQSLTLNLLKAARDYAFSKGAPGVEGYPVPPNSASYTYMGSPSIFLKAGFRDVTPAGQKRIVMRHLNE